MKAVDSIDVGASRQRVFDVLCEPTSYLDWVVGSGRFRGVDAEWPAVGSRFHHTVGVWPFEVRDATELRHIEAPARIELRAMVRPFFEAVVEIRLDDVGYGRTRVTLTERPVGGLASYAGRLSLPALSLRNRLALRRLARVVASRSA